MNLKELWTVNMKKRQFPRHSKHQPHTPTVPTPGDGRCTKNTRKYTKIHHIYIRYTYPRSTEYRLQPLPHPTPPYPTSFFDPLPPSHPLHIGVHLDKASQGARLAFATEPHTPAVLPNQNTKDGENGPACIDGSYKEGCDKTHTKKMVHQPTC